MWLSPPGVIDALNYWGSVPGWKLMSWGVAEDLEETRGTRSTCCCAAAMSSTPAEPTR